MKENNFDDWCLKYRNWEKKNKIQPKYREAYLYLKNIISNLRESVR